MPRPDDLVGLLRSFDGAMRALAPPPGHEARMRARLAKPEARRLARPLALALCTAVASAAIWSVWTLPESPEVSIRPLSAPPAPSASTEVSAEPRLAPPATAPVQPPAWVPRHPVPALPILRPRSEITPIPAPSPRSPDPVTTPHDVSIPDSPSRTARSPAERSAEIAAATPAPMQGRTAPPLMAWGAAPAPDAPPQPTLAMGGPPSPHPAAHDMPVYNGAHPASTGDPPASSGKGPEDPATDSPDTCTWGSVSTEGKCLSPDDLQSLAQGTCTSKGLALGALIPAFDCGGVGSTVAKMSCCGPASPASPAEEDPAPTCKPATAGDGLTCTDVGWLTKQLDATCASWGLAFTKVDTWTACAPDSAMTLSGWCCPAPEPDPGPPPAGVVGDGVSCTPNDDLEEGAASTCEKLGLVLIDFWPADDCDGDASTAAKYVCAS